MQMNKKATVYCALLTACLIVTTVFFVLDIRIAFVISLSAAVLAVFLMIKAGPRITLKNQESLLGKFQKASEKHIYLYAFLFSNIIIAFIRE